MLAEVLDFSNVFSRPSNCGWNPFISKRFLPQGGFTRQLYAVDLIKLPSVQCLSCRQNIKNLCRRVIIFIKKDSHILCQNIKLCKMRIPNLELYKWSFQLMWRMRCSITVDNLENINRTVIKNWQIKNSVRGCPYIT